MPPDGLLPAPPGPSNLWNTSAACYSDVQKHTTFWCTKNKVAYSRWRGSATESHSHGFQLCLHERSVLFSSSCVDETSWSTQGKRAHE